MFQNEINKRLTWNKKVKYHSYEDAKLYKLKYIIWSCIISVKVANQKGPFLPSAN